MVSIFSQVIQIADYITDLSLTLKLELNPWKSSAIFSNLQQSLVTFANFPKMFRNICVAIDNFTHRLMF